MVPNRFEFAGAKQLLRLLDAVMAIGSEQSLADALRRITEVGAELVDARYAALGVLDESGSRLAEFITVGFSDEETARIGARPEGHGILGLLILDPKPLRLPDLHAHPDSFGFPPGHPPMTSFLGVPIRLRGVVYGNLYLTDKADGQVFTDVDQELAVGLAAAAGLAIENARLHEQTRTAGLLDERERIARDLHDDVIQRLFATGLSLQAAAHTLDDPAAVARITGAVDELNVSIRQIRSTIFELNQRRSAVSQPARRHHRRLRRVGHHARVHPALRHPRVRSTAPSSSRHAATCCCACAKRCPTSPATPMLPPCRSIVSVDGGRLSLHVVDDGVGYRPTPGQPSSGLDNMRVRASALGGTFSIERRAEPAAPSRRGTSLSTPDQRRPAGTLGRMALRRVCSPRHVSVVSARSSGEATVTTPTRRPGRRRRRRVERRRSDNRVGSRRGRRPGAASLRIVSFAVRRARETAPNTSSTSDALVDHVARSDLVDRRRVDVRRHDRRLRRCVPRARREGVHVPIVVVRGEARSAVASDRRRHRQPLRIRSCRRVGR